MTDSPAAASICPLCGRDNQCAIAAGKPPETCWCWNAEIDTRAKEQAAEYASERCLCPACGQPEEVRADEG